jgi:D-3-phosphoglycerate dehydrogenase
MRPSVLVTKRIYIEGVELLRKHFDVDYEATDDGLPREELIRRARGKQAIVSHLTDKLDGPMLDSLDGLRVIANVAVGFDNIDIAAATRRGILVTNTPGVLTETTADLAFALLMSAARRIVEADKFLHSGLWKCWTIDLMAGQDIYDRTLGIFGMGRIGQAVARRGRGFSMRVLYHDRVRASEELERELSLEYVGPDRLLRESDFVSLHVPLTAETRGLIGRRELELMKPNAILINTARGPVVDEAALAEALREKRIAAAGLDVFEREPQVNPLLLKLDNVVLTPHIASASVATRRRMSVMAAEDVVAALAGQRPPHLVNTDLWR